MRRGLGENSEHPENVVVNDHFGETFIPGGWIAGRRDVWPN